MAEHNPFPGENNTGHIWDDDLRELQNPPPRWWMLAFYASIIWWIVYGILYPMIPIGHDSTKGLMGWTQMKEYEQGLSEIQAMRAQYEEQIAQKSAAEILADPELKQYTIASAKVLFGDYCAACHGGGGAGNVDYPVLADNDWLYGGQIDNIVQSITLGRQSMMPAHLTAGLIDDAEATTLAEYVVGLSEGKGMDHDAKGQELFMGKGCIACHGMDAKGMQMLGGANLTDSIWRFMPGGVESAKHTIAHGVNDPSDPLARNAVMPAFNDRLGEHDIKKLAVYVHQFGGGVPPL